MGRDRQTREEETFSVRVGSGGNDDVECEKKDIVTEQHSHECSKQALRSI